MAIFVSHLLWAPFLIRIIRATVGNHCIETDNGQIRFAIRVFACCLHLIALSTTTRWATRFTLSIAGGTMAIRARLTMIWILHRLCNCHRCPTSCVREHVQGTTATTALVPIKMGRACLEPIISPGQSRHREKQRLRDAWHGI